MARNLAVQPAAAVVRSIFRSFFFMSIQAFISFQMKMENNFKRTNNESGGPEAKKPKQQNGSAFTNGKTLHMEQISAKCSVCLWPLASAKCYHYSSRRLH